MLFLRSASLFLKGNKVVMCESIHCTTKSLSLLMERQAFGYYTVAAGVTGFIAGQRGLLDTNLAAFVTIRIIFVAP